MAGRREGAINQDGPVGEIYSHFKSSGQDWPLLGIWRNEPDDHLLWRQVAPSGSCRQCATNSNLTRFGRLAPRSHEIDAKQKRVSPAKTHAVASYVLASLKNECS